MIKTETFTIKLHQIKSETDQLVAGMEYGWFIEFELEALNLHRAISFAYEMSEFLLSSLTLETGVESFKANPILGYDITQGISERDFVQYYYNSPYSKPQRADFETYMLHLETIWIYQGKRKDRLYRSIRWFRKGINEDDPMDQFLNLYQGLETLNPVLAEHYGIEGSSKATYEVKCALTGEIYHAERTTKAGLDMLVEEIGIDASVWKEITRVRNKIAHGYVGLQELNEQCIQLVPEVGKLLHEGISTILGFESDEQVTKQIANIAPVKFGGVQIHEFKLLETDVNKLAKDYDHPYVMVKFNDVQLFEEGPRIGYRVVNTCEAFIGCKFSSNAFAVSGRGADLEIEDVQ